MAFVLLAVLPACGQRTLTDSLWASDGATHVADARTDGSARAGTDGSTYGGTDGPPAAPACVPGVPTGPVTGTIGDRSFTLDPTSLSSDGWPVLQKSWSILRAASADQALIAWGESGPDGGTQSNAGAVLVLPETSTSGATYYCAARVEAELTSDPPDPKVAIALSQLSVLGQCPGAPVSGNVQLCTDQGPPMDGGDGACAQGFGVSGTVDGIAIDIRNVGGTVLDGAGTPDSIFEVIGSDHDDGLILVESGADGSVSGWLRVPNDAGPNAGTIFCLAGGHLTALAAHVYSVTFQSYGRLGQCPGSSIGGMVNLCQ
jgi:hypothetical protein